MMILKILVIINIINLEVLHIKEIDKFKQLVHSKSNKIIFFKSSKCYYCTKFNNIYQKLSNDLDLKLDFYEFNEIYMGNKFKVDNIIFQFPIVELYLDDQSFRFHGEHNEINVKNFIISHLESKVNNIDISDYNKIEDFCLKKEYIDSKLEETYFNNNGLVILYYGKNDDKNINILSQIKNFYNINIVSIKNNPKSENKAIICRKYDFKILNLNLDDLFNTNFFKIKNFELPVLHELNEYLFDKFSYNNMKVLFYFPEEETDEFMDIMKNDILGRKNIYKIFIITKNNKYYNRFYYYFEISEIPSLILVTKFNNKIKKFKYNEIFEEDEFKIFLNKYENNWLKTHTTNQKLDQENISVFMLINYSKYQLILKDVRFYYIILVYGDQNMIYNEYLNKLGETYSLHFKNKMLKLGMLDHFKNDIDLKIYPILPYIMIKTPKGKVSIFLENLSVENLSGFINNNLEKQHKQVDEL